MTPAFQKWLVIPDYPTLLVKVRDYVGDLFDLAECQPDKFRDPAAWFAVYDANDELSQGTPPEWAKQAHRIVQSMLDWVKPVLSREPHNPGYLRDVMWAYQRLTHIVGQLRSGQLK